MAKRELSNTLKNLKFMQRATQREEKTKKEEEINPDGNFASPGTVIKQKCVVIMEGDPHPGAVRGRMSFLNFNPSIDKLNEDASECDQLEGSAAAGQNSGRPLDRENDLSKNKSRITEMDMHSPDGELKRKQPGEATEFLHPNKLQKNGNGDPEPPSGPKKSSNKQSEREKLDWNVLRPSKGKGKKGLSSLDPCVLLRGNCPLSPLLPQFNNLDSGLILATGDFVRLFGSFIGHLTN